MDLLPRKMLTCGSSKRYAEEVKVIVSGVMIIVVVSNKKSAQVVGEWISSGSESDSIGSQGPM